MSSFPSRKFPSSKTKAKIPSRGFASSKPSKKKDLALPERPMTEKAREARIEELKKELKTLEDQG